MRARVSSGFGVIAAAAAGVFLGALPASADGMPRGGSFKDVPIAVPWTWQGLYIGAHGGLVTGNTQGDTDFVDTDYSVNGGMVGGQLGYNLQWGVHVVGIEGTWAWANVQGSTDCDVGPFNLRCKRNMDSVATLTGRYGVSLGNTLFYGMGGAAWADVKTRVTEDGDPFLSASKQRVGWVAGFGIEHMFTDRISGRIEYAHFDFGRENQTLTGAFDVPDRVDLTMDTVRVGLNVKLAPLTPFGSWSR